jgi:hypothetical protein
MTATTATPTPNAFLTHVGNLSMHRSDDATAYVLTVTATGEYVGTYPTARAASDAGIARITAAYKARRRA